VRAVAPLAFGALVAGGLAVSCGDDGTNPCPTGSCDLPGSTIVKWRFNHFPMLGFDSDACSDLGVVMVRVELTDGAGTPTDMVEKVCSEGQATFLGLPGGTYTAKVTPLDADGNALVTAPVSAMVMAAANNTTLDTTVDVNHPAWSKAYTGQLLWRLKWGGQSCAMATPPVVSQTLTLTAGGVVRTESASIDNTVYQKLDGTESKPCVPLTSQFPMNVMGLPWGPATMLVVGYDGATPPVEVFRKSFDTFIGAGVFNPTFQYDVPAPPMIDAGIDAM
jgi:hypothetical protein